MSGPFGSSQWMTASGDFEIRHSLRMNAADVPELKYQPSSDSNRRTWTYSFWTKRSSFDSTHQVMFEARDGDAGSSDNIKWEDGQLAVILQDGTLGRLKSTALFRDVTSWYHIVVAVDTTQGTNTNRVKIYVNGVQLTSFTGTNTYPSQNDQTRVNMANADQQWGNTRHPDNDFGLHGYLAEINFVDGAQLAPTAFGEYNDYGQWIPISPECTYGTEGYRLQFNNSTASAAGIGLDTSGNGHNFTPDNIVATDQVIDSPTNNFATVNNLDSFAANSNITLKQGNLNLDFNSDSGNSVICGTFPVASGKWYFEFAWSSGSAMVGIAATSVELEVRNFAGTSNKSFQYNPNGRVYNGGGNYEQETTWSDGDVIGVAFDLDNSKIYFAKNNTWQNSGDPAAGSNTQFDISNIGEVVPVFGNGGAAYDAYANFGQDSSFNATKTAQGNTDSGGIGDFYYTPPTGFKALCTKNLPEPSIVPTEHFKTVLYTGDTATDRDIQVGFRPGWTWIKKRNGEQAHMIWDIMRGGTKRLSTNVNNAEATDSDGVDTGKTNAQIGGGGGFRLLQSNGAQNTNGDTYVSWNWFATDSGGVANNAGQIDSSNNVNTTAGFSIVTYTGVGGEPKTVGHGLGVSPDWLMVKRRDASSNWVVWTKDLDDKYAFEGLNTVGAAITGGSPYSKYVDAVSSTLVTLGDDSGVNHDNGTFVMYCFASKAGYSKVGTYVGNGAANGPFVYTGFRPAWVMVKSSSMTNSETNWVIWDNKRNGYNDNIQLFANDDMAEGRRDDDGGAGVSEIDFLATGFKHRDATWAQNGSDGATFVYLAFAETPFKYSNAR